MKRIVDYFSLVKFSHSIFALPFALQSAWLAAGGMPDLRTLALICACAVSARTAAMGFNRLVDRDIDARNPRTQARELPAGTLSVNGVRLLVLVSCALFSYLAFLLNPLAGWLSFPVLGCLLGYSYVKRFSSFAHLVLGVALGLAPLGAWVAVRGDASTDVVPVLLLAAAVTTWVFGFDLIYACQDIDFDRSEGLHSVPVRLGVAGTLRLAKVAHVATTALLVAFWWTAGLGWIYLAAVAVAGVLMFFEHRIVKPDDLSRVNVAFFTLNGWVGVGLFFGLVLDLTF